MRAELSIHSCCSDTPDPNTSGLDGSSQFSACLQDKTIRVQGLTAASAFM